jgi:hypothetical protein
MEMVSQDIMSRAAENFEAYLEQKRQKEETQEKLETTQNKL